MKIVTLIPGDGIGPEIVKSVKKIFRAAGVPKAGIAIYAESFGNDAVVHQHINHRIKP